MAFRYMDLRTNVKKFTTLSKMNKRFQSVLQSVKGFNRKPLNSSFNPVRDSEPIKLYLIQITSKHTGDVTSQMSTDNSHSVAVFNNMIFDHNFKTPLQLSKDNLNKCCVGGSSYVFKYCSRVVELTPTTDTERIIRKNLFKKEQSF